MPLNKQLQLDKISSSKNVVLAKYIQLENMIADPSKNFADFNSCLLSVLFEIESFKVGLEQFLEIDKKQIIELESSYADYNQTKRAQEKVLELRKSEMAARNSKMENYAAEAKKMLESDTEFRFYDIFSFGITYFRKNDDAQAKKDKTLARLKDERLNIKISMNLMKELAEVYLKLDLIVQELKEIQSEINSLGILLVCIQNNKFQLGVLRGSIEQSISNSLIIEENEQRDYLAGEVSKLHIELKNLLLVNNSILCRHCANN